MVTVRSNKQELLHEIRLVRENGALSCAAERVEYSTPAMN